MGAPQAWQTHTALRLAIPSLHTQDPKVVSSVAELQALKLKASSIQTTLLAFSGTHDQGDLGVKSPYCVLEGV